MDGRGEEVPRDWAGFVKVQPILTKFPKQVGVDKAAWCKGVPDLSDAPHQFCWNIKDLGHYVRSLIKSPSRVAIIRCAVTRVTRHIDVEPHFAKKCFLNFSFFSCHFLFICSSDTAMSHKVWKYRYWPLYNALWSEKHGIQNLPDLYPILRNHSMLLTPKCIVQRPKSHAPSTGSKSMSRIMILYSSTVWITGYNGNFYRIFYKPLLKLLWSSWQIGHRLVALFPVITFCTFFKSKLLLIIFFPNKCPRSVK